MNLAKFTAMDQFINVAGTEGKVQMAIFAGCRLLTKTLVIQILFASFCNHFIEGFILEISFQKININLKKTIFKPDGGPFAKSQKHSIVSASLLSFSIKRKQ